MGNRKIMILGASILQLPAIEKALEMGLSVVAVDMNPNAIGFAVDGIEREVISTVDIETVLESARSHDIDGIMTLASDMPTRTVAAVASELGLPGVSRETAYRSTDKAAMRRCFAEYGVPVPRFRSCDSLEECLTSFDALGGDAIIKPVDSAGSRGVSLVREGDSEGAKEAFGYAVANGRSGQVIVEDYMVGPEVSVETLSVDGVCNVIQITDKLTTGAPHFVEMGHTQPSYHSFSVKRQVVEVAISAVEAVGIANGPSHTEIKITPDGPKVVEIGARLGGDCINSHLVPLSTGVDMVENCIRIALGETPRLNMGISGGSAIRYVECDHGIIESINGVDYAKSVPGVYAVGFQKGIGDAVGEIGNSVDRVGFVIGYGDSRQDAVDACEKALSMIEVKVSRG
ncbi:MULTISPECIES: ATP-grasp domain-containing protein [unclassified Adlercreutzia]|uniref:ATP-grasp domain-containing protein n=1 Tax=unclassified Adlercreutzia TaxID=2636013 RepID=UPI0019801D75|nr:MULTISPECIES: ATP-grasp domain-containing protein [unclassified Adlercreutzia]